MVAAMIVETDIARTLRLVEKNKKRDINARKLVAHKPILAYILKSAIEELADIPVKRIAEELIIGTPEVRKVSIHQDEPDADMSAADTEKLSGDSKIDDLVHGNVSARDGSVYFDIRFEVLIPKENWYEKIIVDLELQNKNVEYPIPKRGNYYASRLISAQRSTIFKDQEYGKIVKVVSIWVLLNPTLEKSNFLNEYRITEDCKLGSFKEEKVENYDQMRIVVMGLGAAGETSSDDAIRLLSVLFSDKLTVDEILKRLSDEFNIEVTKEIEEEVTEISEWGSEILDEGMSIGAGMGTLRNNIVLFRDNIISKANAVMYSNVDTTTFEKFYDAYLEGEDVFQDMWKKSIELAPATNR